MMPYFSLVPSPTLMAERSRWGGLFVSDPQAMPDPSSSPATPWNYFTIPSNPFLYQKFFGGFVVKAIV